MRPREKRRRRSALSKDAAARARDMCLLEKGADFSGSLELLPARVRLGGEGDYVFVVRGPASMARLYVKVRTASVSTNGVIVIVEEMQFRPTRGAIQAIRGRGRLSWLQMRRSPWPTFESRISVLAKTQRSCVSGAPVLGAAPCGLFLKLLFYTDNPLAQQICGIGVPPKMPVFPGIRGIRPNERGRRYGRQPTLNIRSTLPRRTRRPRSSASVSLQPRSRTNRSARILARIRLYIANLGSTNSSL
jgi:hypothetical protein